MALLIGEACLCRADGQRSGVLKAVASDSELSVSAARHSIGPTDCVSAGQNGLGTTHLNYKFGGAPNIDIAHA